MSELWRPVHASHVGARHQARGEGCQDSSLSLGGTLADGTPFSLLAVADGHGDSRHYRSAIGSRLACALTAELVQDAAREAGTDWSQWCAGSFAADLPQRWREQCAADHRQQGSGEPFSTVPYGSTLGMVLLTPRWWACAGLGDWDLALIDSHGARVVSSEPPQPGGGETTYSLCMEAPQPLIAARCQWHPLEQEPPPRLALVLTSDGVRKSCLSEQDYLVLCHYLAKEALPEPLRDEGVDLVAALAQITRGGIGDDVSVASAALGALQLRGQLDA